MTEEDSVASPRPEEVKGIWDSETPDAIFIG